VTWVAPKGRWKAEHLVAPMVEHLEPNWAAMRAAAKADLRAGNSERWKAEQLAGWKAAYWGQKSAEHSVVLKVAWTAVNLVAPMVVCLGVCLVPTKVARWVAWRAEKWAATTEHPRADNLVALMADCSALKLAESWAELTVEHLAAPWVNLTAATRVDSTAVQ